MIIGTLTIVGIIMEETQSIYQSDIQKREGNCLKDSLFSDSKMSICNDRWLLKQSNNQPQTKLTSMKNKRK